MSSALTQVLERASVYADFRAELASDPESALAGYALTSEERAALMSGDSHQLQDLGVDARVTKQVSEPTTDTPWPTPHRSPSPQDQEAQHQVLFGRGE
jgi:hypothetical protein